MSMRGIPLAAFVLAGSLAAAAGDAPDGAAIFQARCAKCHGESGNTETQSARALKVRPLRNDPEIAARSPEEIARAIRTDTKHQTFPEVSGLAARDLDAVAAFVKQLATRR